MTNLSYIQIEPFGLLIADVVRHSVQMAREYFKLLPSGPTFGVIDEWGIKVAMWVPRRIQIPHGVPITLNTQI
jgi:hypothetical protein